MEAKLAERAYGRFEILNKRGLHARAASKLVKLASSFSCDIQLSGASEEAVSAKSVMGVLLLCGTKGTIIDVHADGDGAKQAVAAIGALIADLFGEGE